MVHITLGLVWLLSFPFLNKKVPFYLLGFLLLLLFSMLRYDFGNDYMSYYHIFNDIHLGNNLWNQVDELFVRISLFFPNFYTFIAATSIFHIFSVRFLIRKNLKVNKYWFALLIFLINPYLYLVQLSSVSQTLAICCFIFAVHYGIQRKIIKYSFFIFLAAGFHQSAILLLPVYFILNDKQVNRKKILMFVVAVALLLFTPLWWILIETVINHFPQYRHYVAQAGENSLRATILSSFFFFLIINNLNKMEGRQLIYGKLGLIATSISVLALRLSMITRIGMYFDVFLILAIPYVFEKIERKWVKQIIFTVMIVIFVLRYISFFSNPMWFSFREYNTIINVPLP